MKINISLTKNPVDSDFKLAHETVLKLTNYNLNWKVIAEQEINKILDTKLYYPWIKDVRHVGSTSIPGMSGKPVIDLLVGYNDQEYSTTDLERISYMDTLGYLYNSTCYHQFVRLEESTRLQLNVLVVPYKCLLWNARIAFRDYFIDHPEEIKNYIDLKKRCLRRLKIYMKFNYARMKNLEIYERGKIELEYYSMLTSKYIYSIFEKLGYPCPENLVCSLSSSIEQQTFTLQPYNSQWPEIAALEIKKFIELNHQYPWIKDVRHVGSTSIPGMSGKPIIELYFAYDSTDLTLTDEIIEQPLKRLDYIAPEENKHAIFWSKTIANKYHVTICIVPFLSPRWDSRLAYRQYFLDNPKEIQNYINIKKNSYKQAATFEEYCEGKNQYIRKILIMAGFEHASESNNLLYPNQRWYNINKVWLECNQDLKKNNVRRGEEIFHIAPNAPKDSQGRRIISSEDGNQWLIDGNAIYSKDQKKLVHYIYSPDVELKNKNIINSVKFTYKERFYLGLKKEFLFNLKQNSSSIFSSPFLKVSYRGMGIDKNNVYQCCKIKFKR